MKEGIDSNQSGPKTPNTKTGTRRRESVVSPSLNAIINVKAIGRQNAAHVAEVCVASTREVSQIVPLKSVFFQTLICYLMTVIFF